MKHKIWENIKFIYLDILDQYLLVKLEKKKNYTNIKFSKKLPTYYIKLPVFWTKLSMFSTKYRPRVSSKMLVTLYNMMVTLLKRLITLYKIL